MANYGSKEWRELNPTRFFLKCLEIGTGGAEICEYFVTISAGSVVLIISIVLVLVLCLSYFSFYANFSFVLHANVFVAKL